MSLIISKPSCPFILSIKLVSGGPLIIPGAFPDQDVQVSIASLNRGGWIQAFPDRFARVYQINLVGSKRMYAAKVRRAILLLIASLLPRRMQSPQ
ncbi:MAG: hypothetical protein RJB42_1583 [Bacteroidota bacterium]